MTAIENTPLSWATMDHYLVPKNSPEFTELTDLVIAKMCETYDENPMFQQAYHKVYSPGITQNQRIKSELHSIMRCNQHFFWGIAGTCKDYVHHREQ